MTGVSGSGKSSLAFEVLYAEGQRRYVETFSPYTRQFMDRMDRPAAEIIENIPPAVAIGRGDQVRTSRSTVGTMIEITEHVKVLFARLGRLHCRSCGQAVSAEEPEAVWRRLAQKAPNERAVITFPHRIAPGGLSAGVSELMRQGYDRCYRDEHTLSVQETVTQWRGGRLDVVVDRLVIAPENRERLIDSLEQAYRMGGGRLDVWLPKGGRQPFSRRLECARCGIAYSPPPTSLFSFNNPLGACSTCRGFGRVIGVDPQLVVPDERLSLEEGAVKPWGRGGKARREYSLLLRFCRKHGIPTDVPFAALADDHRALIFNGSGRFPGVYGFFRRLERKTYKMHVRVFLSRYRSYERCPDCGGTRFRPEALLYRLQDLNIAQVYALDVAQAAAFFKNLPLAADDEAGHLVLGEVRQRLRYLQDVGLGYLTLDRQSRTLSGGEVQRVALAAALGSSLVETLYVLDEPSIGLHPRDTERLMGILRGIRDLDNTVVVVEHDADIMTAGDMLLDLGPGAGENGGRVMYYGPTAKVGGSLTAEYLTGKRRIPQPAKYRKAGHSGWLQIRGCAEHNLKDIDVDIPLGCLVCLTGVSGSGKSTLAENILYRGLKRALGGAEGRPGKHAGIQGAENIGDVVLVDQKPIGRTPRANALTYTRALAGVRRRLAATKAARRMGFGPSHFSFNVPGGRCETCKGEGFERVEMQFLSDVLVSCPDCNGRRFQQAVLAVTYHGRNIHQILEMTIREALAFFAEADDIKRALAPLETVGLGYLRLGQPLSTLSGGEAQRLKLSRHIGAGGGGRLFIFDEPTTGLHFHDIRRLVAVFQQLVTAGNSVLVIEHHLDVIKNADWVIDLGPEGGEAGGRVVACGTLVHLLASAGSHTGRYLKRHLQGPVEPRRNRSSVKYHAPGPAAPEHGCLAVQGAREHNLKNIDLSLDRNQMVVFTGVSGSGKSTLAFDVLFAEGQRRYLETLTPYARQFIKILERPEVDRVSGIPPTVAIEQRISQGGRRSTVATLTEVYHFLRLLFSKVGERHCPGCGKRLQAVSRDAMAAYVRRHFARQRALVLAPKVYGRKGLHRKVLADAVKKGFTEARIDGQVVPLAPGMTLARYHTHTIEIVAGRLPVRAEAELRRIVDTALAEGGGSLLLAGTRGREIFLSLSGVCPTCGIGLTTPDPRLFSFNSAYGACPDCRGLGTLEVKEDAGQAARACRRCGGSRLNAQALAVTLGGYSIWDMVQLPAGRLGEVLKGLRFPAQQRALVEPVLAEIMTRLAMLDRLGLSYLALSRSGATLSGGEAQRLRLAAQLGSNLSGVCYILDEPTIGLHPRDCRALLDALTELRDRGNTILVVEHDEQTVNAADTIVEIGPGAGRKGGRVVFSGSPARARAGGAGASLKKLLTASRRPITSRRRAADPSGWLGIEKACANNLKNIDVSLPLGNLICVTGVSGSGKSSLLKETVCRELQARLQQRKPPGNCHGMTGWRTVARVLEVDHSPIGRTPRSIPASYIDILGGIRRLFAGTPEARVRGYGAGRFSFNLPGGRCESCKGQGRPRVRMNFLPDAFVACDACGARRFNAETLQVRYKGKDIHEVLQMTFNEALAFFDAVPALKKPISFVCRIGLGYLQLGQPSPTLSGGEAQRMKLARQLTRPGRGHTLYILDEPTTGLHPEDVERLLAVLHSLVDAGNTVAVIEHNLEVILEADYILDLGPGGGQSGGGIVAQGSPREIMEFHKVSHTASYLRKYVNMSEND